MARQTTMGKAFEYASLHALHEALRHNQEVVVVRNSSLEVARERYCSLTDRQRHGLDLAAEAAVRVIMRQEPQLQNSNENVPLILEIQPDARGIAGDVRDVLCIRRQNEWEIGLSCKHNHSAVKHSRLSNTIDFGQQWFGRPCSRAYFDHINPLFAELRTLAAAGAYWRDVVNKDQRFYVPLLIAFVTELQLLDDRYPNEIPAALIRYLLGRNDFYKVIARNRNRTTEVHAYNMFGTLNRNSGTVRPETRVPHIRVPDRFLDIGFRRDSTTTVIVYCDNGWSVSLRIHNASSRVEPSLKFDVNLVGVPDNLYRFVERWGD